MTITSKFYTGPVNNINWAEGLRAASYRYVVSDDAGLGTGFKVAVNGGITRGFTVAAGVASGGGITDINDATLTGPTYALPFNATDRWWLIGLRRVWGSTKATAVDWISAGSTKVLPTRPMVPGVEDFQPLALAFVAGGGGSITTIADLRCLGGNSGQLVTFDDLARSYLTQIGTRLLHVKTAVAGGTTAWERTVDEAGTPVWVSRRFSPTTPACRVSRTTGSTISSSSVPTYLTFNLENLDTDSMHDTVTLSNRITIKTAGVYAMGMSVEFADHASNYSRYGCAIRLNGGTVLVRSQNTAATGAVPYYADADTMMYLNVGDFIEGGVFQLSSGDRAIAANDGLTNTTGASPIFWAVWLGA